MFLSKLQLTPLLSSGYRLCQPDERLVIDSAGCAMLRFMCAHPRRIQIIGFRLAPTE